MPILHAMRKAHSKNIRFSHCALSFGDEPPLRSERCFTSNGTDSAGPPFRKTDSERFQLAWGQLRIPA